MKDIGVWQSFKSIFFFSQTACYFFSKLHSSSQIFHSWVELTSTKNIDQSQKKMVRKRFLYFFLDRYVYGLSLLSLKRKINTCEERKRERKLWIIRSGTSFLFFFSLFQRKKKPTHKKNKSNIWEQTKATSK